MGALRFQKVSSGWSVGRRRGLGCDAPLLVSTIEVWARSIPCDIGSGVAGDDGIGNYVMDSADQPETGRSKHWDLTWGVDNEQFNMAMESQKRSNKAEPDNER